jgi:hypothetical protein
MPTNKYIFLELYQKVAIALQGGTVLQVAYEDSSAKAGPLPAFLSQLFLDFRNFPKVFTLVVVGVNSTKRLR